MRKVKRFAFRKDYVETFEAPPPCFVNPSHGPSAACKQGKSLCRACLDKLSGVEYPLRTPKTGALLKIDIATTLHGAYPAT